MISIIDDRLSTFLASSLTKQVEARLEGLDVIDSNVEEMKGFLKATLDHLDYSDLKEGGAGGKKRKGRDLQRRQDIGL